MARSRTILILFAISVLLSAEPGNTGGTATPGVTVTRPSPVAVEAQRDAKARAAFRQAVSLPRDRVIPSMKIPRQAETGPFEPGLSLNLFPGAPLPLAPVSLAPALEASFSGLANPTQPGRDVIPPDTIGAVGPTHLVSLLNSDFGIFTRLGALIDASVESIDSFWSSVFVQLGLADPPFAFDPKVLYDQHSGRFVAMSLAGRNPPESYLLIAVSTTSNPLDPWVKTAIHASLDTDNVLRNQWADYPCLGVDAGNVYLASNLFDNTDSFQGTKVWVLPKDQPVLNGQGGSLTWTEFKNPAQMGDTVQPAHTFGTAAAEYFLLEGGTNSIRIAAPSFPAGGAPTFSVIGTVSVAPYTSTSLLPFAPQRDSANTIDTSDTRLLNVVYRNGSLWTTHNVLGAGGNVEVAWYQIDPVTPSVVQQGRIGDPSRWYYYPSIAVNQDNDVAIGFSGSSATEFVGGYYTVRKSTDPAGTMQDPALLKAGEASYFKTLNGPSNRWGDYSATAVDPTDNVSFWTLQEYAALPRVSDGRSMWGTWWGKFPAPGAAPPAPQPPAPGGGGGGGCAVAGIAGPADTLSSGMSLLLLFLPACALSARRRISRRRRAAPEASPPARPGAP